MGSREHAHQELKNPPVSQTGFQGCVYLLHNGSVEQNDPPVCAQGVTKGQHLQGVHYTWNIVSCAHAHKLKLTMETAGTENRSGLCWRSAGFEPLAPNSKQASK